MAVTEEKLKEIIEPKADIEKLSTISSDGERLLTRIPKDIEQELNLKKGYRIRWLVKEGSNEITINLEDGSKKKENNN